MSTPALHESQELPATTEPQAPALPVEGSIVAAVRALEAAKGQAERALLQLQYGPRDEPEMFACLSALQGSVTTAWNAYAGYCEIRTCKGQA